MIVVPRCFSDEETPSGMDFFSPSAIKRIDIKTHPISTNLLIPYFSSRKENPRPPRGRADHWPEPRNPPQSRKHLNHCEVFYPEKN